VVALFKDESMKHEVSCWPSLMRDGGWETKVSGHYWPELVLRTYKDILRVVHFDTDKGGRPFWRLYVNGRVVETGDLADCLERGNTIASCAHLDLAQS